MKVIFVSNAIARLDSGQEVVNLSRKYGWEIQDKRNIGANS